MAFTTVIITTGVAVPAPVIAIIAAVIADDFPVIIRAVICRVAIIIVFGTIVIDIVVFTDIAGILVLGMLALNLDGFRQFGHGLQVRRQLVKFRLRDTGLGRSDIDLHTASTA